MKQKHLYLDNFNVVKINSIIGCYDDINKKSDQIKNNVKYFKKYKVEMTLSPKHPKSYIINNLDYDIGEIPRKHTTPINIKPFFKDNDVYYCVIDAKNINVSCFVYLDDYYSYKDGCEHVKKKIKESRCKYCWEDTVEKFETVFINNNKYFNYTDEIIWC